MHPALARDGGVIQKTQQLLTPVMVLRRAGKIRFSPAPELLNVSGWFLQEVVVIDRRVLGQSTGRHFRRHCTVLQHPNHGLRQDTTHHGRLKSPAPEALHQRFLAASADHEQHPLLGFREQILISRHPLFAGRHLVEIELHADIALGRHLGTTAGETSCPHVLGSHHITALKRLQTGFNQTFFQEGITHLHSRSIVERGGTELSTGKTGSPHAVAACGATDIDDGIADAGGPRFDNVLGLHQTQCHGIDQWIAAVGGIKGHLAPHGGNTDAIAVVGDTGHHALHQAHIGGILQGAEAQRIQQRNRPSTHGEDVPQNAADPCRSPLEGFNR